MSRNKLPLHDNQLISLDFKNDIDAFKSMMESCYAYDKLSKTNKYILEFKEELGPTLWNETYNNYSKYLKNNYTVEHNIGKDNDGLTYNRLVPRYDKA
tara:strand:- start:126 stop:419 length:294 start_codon:yes stop_codon:yes gene_type:complete